MDILLTVKQAALILKVHPLSIRRYIKSNKLKAIKAGGNIRILEKDLLDFHKKIEPAPQIPSIILNINKNRAKEFTQDDPFLQLKGCAASVYDK